MLEPGSQTVTARSFDWSTTELGDRALWPHVLRLTVDILLHSPLPMLLVWGARRAVVFNDAYAALGGAPPAGVPGGTVPSVWPAPLAAGRDQFERARNGEPALLASAPLSFQRDDGAQQIECDLYFTPIHDEGEQVCGVLCSLARTGRRAVDASPAGLRILVVEDNLDSQYLVCEMLRAFGHQTEGVARGEEALARLGAAEFDVLFSDVSLPGISGVELARQALLGQPGLQVIFASGYGDALLRHVEFPFLSLQKPYELEQLQAALARVSRQPPGPA